MAIRIGHASIDENGKIVGGIVGDQSTKEICFRSWYSKPWNVYLECKDTALAGRAAKIMEQICTDNNFGYDQSERLSGYNSIVKNGNKIHGAKGEFDCSSLVSACYKLAGLDISVSNTTRSIRASFLSTGKFEAYADKSHLISDKFAKRGGIYLKEGSHVVMALEDGLGENPYPVPKTTIYYDHANNKIVCKGDTVKWVQYELINDGITEVEVDGVTKKLSIDGSCGKITDAAIRVYQDKHGLLVDGKVGPNTRRSFLN
jgi:hypothetical protein